MGGSSLPCGGDRRVVQGAGHIHTVCRTGHLPLFGNGRARNFMVLFVGGSFDSPSIVERAGPSYDGRVGVFVVCRDQIRFPSSIFYRDL